MVRRLSRCIDEGLHGDVGGGDVGVAETEIDDIDPGERASTLRRLTSAKAYGGNEPIRLKSIMSQVKVAQDRKNPDSLSW